MSSAIEGLNLADAQQAREAELAERHAELTQEGSGELWPGRAEGRVPIAWHSFDGRETDAVASVMASGKVAGDEQLRAFESELAVACGAKHAIATTSGTSALLAAYLAAAEYTGRKSGDVIVPPLTNVATVNAALMAELNVRFADTEDSTCCLDPAAARATLTPYAVAVVPVHLFGLTYGLSRSRRAIQTIAARAGAVLIEDGAHAIGGEYGPGAPVGSVENGMCCFAFNTQENMTTLEGGAITTGNDDLAELLRAVVRQGCDGHGHERDCKRLGFRGHMSELHAAIGRVQLTKLPGFIARRREIVSLYRKLLVGQRTDRISVPAWPLNESAWHLFPIMAQRRRVLAEALWQRGIEATVHYRSVNLQSFWRERLPKHRDGTRAFKFPQAEMAGEALLSLPCFPAMTDNEVERVADAVKECA